jgi:uncharacterized protein YceK
VVIAPKMKTGWRRAAVSGVFGMVILATTAGCSTLATMRTTNSSTYDGYVPFGIYSGIKTDISIFEEADNVLAYIVGYTYATLDFPFSLVMDTIVLPLSVPWDLLTDPKPRHKPNRRK